MFRGFAKLVLILMFSFLCLSVYFSVRLLLVQRNCFDDLNSLSNGEFMERYLYSKSDAQNQLAESKGAHLQRKKILIAIVTTEKYLLTRAQAIYNTWAQDVGIMNKLLFFVGEHSNISHPALKNLPVVKLKGLRDDIYPPMEKVFGILEYCYKKFGKDFRWFLRADDDVYIRIGELESTLDRLDWTEHLYVGHPGYGVESYRKVLKLLPNENYCMGGPSIVLSAGGLKALYPHLRKCLNAALAYNQRVPKDMGWVYDDVELGRCASRTLGMRCTTGSQSKNKELPFFNDYHSEALVYRNLWKNDLFRQVVTIHPVKEENDMYKIHHFYKSLEVKSLKQSSLSLSNQLNHMNGS